MANLWALFQQTRALREAAQLLHAVPDASWHLALSVDLGHPRHLRFTAHAADGREIAIFRLNAVNTLGDIVVDEFDVYHLIIGTHVFENDGANGRAIQKLYDELTARLQPAIAAFLEAKRAEAHQPAFYSTGTE
jgi:hypothetical protein